MYLRRRAVALAVLGAVVALIVLAVGQLGGGGRANPAPARAARRAIRPAGRRVARKARGTTTAPALRVRLSLDQLAGQRVVYAYSGLDPPASLLTAIRRGEAAGVILFGPNVSSSAQVSTVVAELQRASLASPLHLPLLIVADQEGGEVRRVPGPPVLSERAIGDSGDPLDGAAVAGADAARTLSGAGVNVNLSPVLDVLRSRDDFIDQFHRSYGSDPAEVARLGRAFIQAQQRLGVAATAKHFPGLGAATRGQDTDSRPVTLDLPLAALRSVDEAPFRAAVAGGVKLVMTSWAVYPALDPDAPAGLSARVIKGELRQRLGYRGVTISDTLSAAALTGFGTLAQRGVLAARAGSDLLICSAINGDDDPSDGLSVLHALAGAIADGQLSRAGAEQAAARVLALRESLRPRGRQ